MNLKVLEQTWEWIFGPQPTDPCTNHGFGDRKPVDCFNPFVFDGLVSLTGESAGESQLVILASTLPFSDNSA